MGSLGLQRSWGCHGKFGHPNCMRLVGREARGSNSCVRSSAQGCCLPYLGASGLCASGLLRCWTRPWWRSWPGLVLWTGCFEGCWLLLVVLCPLACVLVG